MTWTGVLNVRRKALGVKLNWFPALLFLRPSLHVCFPFRAYGPGEFKVLVSNDGGNFEEAACWRSTTRSEVSYSESVMFDTALTVKSLTVVMKAPMPWGYFGLNDVSLISSGDEPFMMISGSTSSSGERCLTASGAKLSTEACLDAIASGDGRDVFKFQGEQIAHVASNMCISLINGDAGHVGLQDCKVAAKAQDGRSSWKLTSNAQLKMPRMGNYCLTLEDGTATAGDCGESAQAGNSGDKFLLAAVPELDLSTAASVMAGASLLAAAADRQRSALGNLQALVPSLSTCKFAALTANASQLVKTLSLYQIETRSTAASVFGMDDAAMAAVGKVYASIGVDMGDSIRLISESSSTLQAVAAKIAQSA